MTSLQTVPGLPVAVPGRVDPAAAATAETGPCAQAESTASCPSLLEALSTHPDPAIRRRVARNPSTPEPALLELWREFPEELIENPLVELWLITGKTELADHVPREVLACLYVVLHRSGRRREIEDWLPGRLLRQRLLEQATSQSISGFPDAFAADSIAGLRSDVIRRILRLGSSRSPDRTFSRATLLRLAWDPDPGVRRALAEAICRDPFLPFVPFARRGRTLPWEIRLPVLLALTASGDVPTRKVLAEDRNIPDAVADRLYGDSELEVRLTLLRNTELPCSTIELCLRDPALLMRTTLARFARRSESRERLAADGDERVRAALAENSAAWPSELADLAGDRSLLVRRAIAANPNTPAETLARMAEADPEGLADVLVQNATLRPAARASLIRNAPQASRPGLVRNWRVTPRAFADLLPELGVDAREALAERSGLPDAVVLALARDRSRSVRRIVRARLDDSAFQQDFPIVGSLIDVFLGDRDPMLRAGILRDHRVSDAHIQRALEDPSPIVRTAVARTLCSPSFGVASRLAIDIKAMVRLAAAERWISDGTTGAAFWTRPLACDEAPGLPDFATIVRPLIDHAEIRIAVLAGCLILRALPDGNGLEPDLAGRVAGHVSAALARLESIASSPDAPPVLLRRLVRSQFTPLGALDRLALRNDRALLNAFAERLRLPGIDPNVAWWEAHCRPDLPGRRGTADIRLSGASIRALRSAVDGSSAYRRFVALRSPRIAAPVVAAIAAEDPCLLVRAAALGRLRQRHRGLLNRGRYLAAVADLTAGDDDAAHARTHETS